MCPAQVADRGALGSQGPGELRNRGVIPCGGAPIARAAAGGGLDGMLVWRASLSSCFWRTMEMEEWPEADRVANKGWSY